MSNDLNLHQWLLSVNNQFSVSANTLYEWNIDGLFEQEVMNKLNHITIVTNSYMTNHKLSHPEIVELIVTGFSSKLKAWWDKHLTNESKELIKTAVKKDDDGNPIFNE